MLPFWINLAGALLAAFTNGYAALKGHPNLAPIRASVAALALLYASGYTLVLTDLITDITRARTFQWVSPIVWVVVWVLPAVLGVRAHQRTRRAIFETFRE